MNTDCYTQKFTVQSYECDACSRMLPGAVLRRAQQIATDHSSGLGMTTEVHRKTNTAFLLAKQTVEFYAPVCVGQEIIIETHPAAPKRAVYNRTTHLLAPDGTRLCTVDSCWVLVNTQTRRILRRPPEDFPMPFTAPAEEQLDMSVEKAPAEPVCMQTALFTRCDTNRHLNNTVYADIMCDYVPQEQMLAHPAKKMTIVYHHEVPMGQTFELQRAQLAENKWYFCGVSEEGTHFSADFTLEKQEWETAEL